MRTIAKLFGRSPFGPLQNHMETVAGCVRKVPELFEAVEKGDGDRLAALAQEVSQLEHHADQVKNDIRNHLPRRLFLPVDRGDLLDMLGVQDSIADAMENIGVLLTLRKLDLFESFKPQFSAFLAKNLEAFDSVQLVMREMDELLETGFGGVEADKVKNMVEDVAFKEHEADVLQKELIRRIFACEDQMTYGQFHLWNQVFQEVAKLSNLSEKLAYRMRMTLELK
ncbi:MAG: TIGR00153 family protein [Phycisphaeraceae bacterium]|nr:TIGR00153 family protein [Phycisphaeraceae bacterium]